MTKKTSTERVRRFRERMQAAGFVRHQIWAHPDDLPKVKRLVDRLMAQRFKGENNER